MLDFLYMFVKPASV